MNNLSPYITEQITAGNAVLFLGAGASMGAKSLDGRQIGLSGNQLKDKLSEQFLGGKGKDKTLSYVASLCIDSAGLGAVHRYVETLTSSLVPTRGHELIKEFRWKAIVTTNYDYLIEKSYEGSGVGKTLQTLKRLIWDRDDFSGVSRDVQNLPLLKIHGCLSRLNDPELPLILSSHDYYKFKKNRVSLFNNLREWALSHPIIFCGYSIADENIRDLLFDVSEPTLQRPRFALVDPALEPHDIDYWKSHRFDCLPLKFDAFMQELHTALPPSTVLLGTLFRRSTSSIGKIIPSHIEPSRTLQRYLDAELFHMHAAMPSAASPTTLTAESFFKGDSAGFSWIGLAPDVHRGIVDTLLNDVVLNTGKNSSDRAYFYILNGYAGSGKSVALKRFAWEAAVNYGANVFYLSEGGVLRTEELLELCSLVKSRIFVVLDDALKNKADLVALLAAVKSARVPISLIAGARTNEWNVSSEMLAPQVTLEYELLDLVPAEIRALLKKLEVHKCLGYLETLPIEDRYGYLREKLKSQLLVALLEATEGKSFLKIVFDEYEQVSPIEAKLLYLDICTLDRFDVGVRAGLLSRISGVTFSSFTQKLLAPLEHVVFTYYDHKIGDYIYRSRHHQIADLVFGQAMKSASERAQQITRIIRYLNSGYDSDRRAIDQLVKGRILATEFTDKSLAYGIFSAAQDSGVEAAVIHHQRCVFEMHHPGGDLRAALHLLTQAEKNPGSVSPKTLAHTRANLLRRLALIASTPLEKARLRQDSLALLNRATQSPRDSLPFVTKGQLLLEELRERTEVLKDNTEEDNEIEIRVIDELSKQIELNLRDGLKAFPGEERLLLLEAELAKFLQNSPRALHALEKAFSRNKDSIYTAIRLARHYFQTSSRKDAAVNLIRKLVSSHQTSKEAHFELAKMLMEIAEAENEREIGQHLKRSFSPGDSHYDARYFYARHQFLYGNREESRIEFQALSRAGLPPAILNRIRGEIRDPTGQSVRYQGAVSSMHESFAFLRCSQFPDEVFLHHQQMVAKEDWGRLAQGIAVSFTLGFTFKGPAANRVMVTKP